MIEPLTFNVPEIIAVSPVKVLAPLSVNMPLPLFVTPPPTPVTAPLTATEPWAVTVRLLPAKYTGPVMANTVKGLARIPLDPARVILHYRYCFPTYWRASRNRWLH